MMEILQNLTSWERSTYIYVAVSVIANIFFTVIVIIGGGFDMFYMFKELNKEADQIHTKPDS